MKPSDKPEVGNEPSIPTTVHEPVEAPRRGWRRIIPGDVTRPRPRAEPSLEQRCDPRFPVDLRAGFTGIDPSRNPVTGEAIFVTTDEERAVNLSRRGACLECNAPPEVGSRVLLRVQLDGEDPVEVVSRVRWSRVQYTPGKEGGRACAAVGFEILGAPPDTMARYEHALRNIARRNPTSVATREALG